MSEKTYKIRGLMESAESLHVGILMFVRIEDVFCVNGATTVRKSPWQCVPTYKQFGAEKASSSHKCDLDILCSEMDQFNATHSNCKHKDK